MGQKVSPIANRLMINKTSDSRWTASKKNYAAFLMEDYKIRAFLEKKLEKAGLAKVVIERLAKKLVITIHSSRPGIIIGKNGADIEALRNGIKKLVNNDNVIVNIVEVRKADINATLVGKSIAQQIEGRVSFKRAMKKAMQNAEKAGAKGIKITVSGRLNGAEIAREESMREGRIPLHTLRADIDYASVQAKTTYGIIGVKVWVYTGDVVNEEKLANEMSGPREFAATAGNRGPKNKEVR
ncbi:MAG: 30S ribosomal protein S3 [Rickettsiales bacterium]|jgi:small subunit ribosomal protein S3|nr:30S ribosomal protein S3 [Rickettsiales bacterium]